MFEGPPTFDSIEGTAASTHTPLLLRMRIPYGIKGFFMSIRLSLKKETIEFAA